MAWKDILVFVDGSESGLVRADVAAALASAVGADLEVCVPVFRTALLASGSLAMAIAVQDQLDREARDQANGTANAIRSRMLALADRLVVSTPERRLGELPSLAASLGQTCDLTIVGQPVRHGGTLGDTQLLEGSLFGAGSPCLMLPRWTEPHVWGRRVLIAWKNVPEAARAVHDAMPILQRADAVCVATAVHGAAHDSNLAESVERLLRHLWRFGVRSETRTVVTNDSAGKAVLDEVERWSADLLVMGGYGHSRLRERVLGGVTRTALRESPIPVLLSH